jgi:RNA polymerase-interacting CarD/CdnL/TRCF family regulator
MNVKEGLTEIRVRLIENGAKRDTVKMVDMILQRASLPAASGASATSMLQLVRMLMRNSVSNSNAEVYNDLVKLESQLEARADEFRALRDEEERMANPKDPKSKKFYKTHKK